MSRLDTESEGCEPSHWPAIAVDQLKSAIHREPEYPSRPELRNRLDAIEKAAQFLMKELADLKILAHLEDDGERIANANEVYHGLRDIAARAERAHARISARQGRGSAYPSNSNGPSPRKLCALWVGMGWEKIRGKWPGMDSPKAQRLCAALWKEAGGVPPAWDTTAVWRDHLNAAKKYRPPAPAGAVVQRLLEALPSNEDIAAEFLRNRLADGSVPRKVIKSEAEEAGLAWGTVRRVANDLGIAERRVGGPGRDGEWQWRLSNQEDLTPLFAPGKRRFGGKPEFPPRSSG
jgi:hypothetical protein